MLNVQMLSGDTQSIDENLLSWTITDVTAKSIEISLEFD